MADMTLCDGHNCPTKRTCVRHNLPAGRWQSWFAHVPYDHALSVCTHYIPDADIPKKTQAENISTNPER